MAVLRLGILRADGLEELQAVHGQEGALEYVVRMLRHCRHEDLAKVLPAPAECLAATWRLAGL